MDCGLDTILLEKLSLVLFEDAVLGLANPTAFGTPSTSFMELHVLMRVSLKKSGVVLSKKPLVLVLMVRRNCLPLFGHFKFEQPVEGLWFSMYYNC